MPRSYASDLLVDGIDLGAERSSVASETTGPRRSDMLMLLIAAAGCAAVIANAFFFQDGRRAEGVAMPAPAAAPARPAAAPAPAVPDTAAVPAQPETPAIDTPDAVPVALAPATPLPPVKPPVPKVVKTDPSTAAPAVAGQAAAPAGTVAAPVSLRPPADLGGASARVMEVQKALARLGYGPIRIDGKPSPETRAAIQRFEADRRLPVTGQVSDRLVRELNAVAGFSIR